MMLNIFARLVYFRLPTLKVPGHAVTKLPCIAARNATLALIDSAAAVEVQASKGFAEENRRSLCSGKFEQIWRPPPTPQNRPRFRRARWAFRPGTKDRGKSARLGTEITNRRVNGHGGPSKQLGDTNTTGGSRCPPAASPTHKDHSR